MAKPLEHVVLFAIPVALDNSFEEAKLLPVLMALDLQYNRLRIESAPPILMYARVKETNNLTRLRIYRG